MAVDNPSKEKLLFHRGQKNGIVMISVVVCKFLTITNSHRLFIISNHHYEIPTTNIAIASKSRSGTLS